MYDPLKDIYPLILARLNPKEIVNWSSSNKHNRSLLTEDFWIALINIRWGNLENVLVPHLEYQQRYRRDLKLFFESAKVGAFDVVLNLLSKGIDVDLQNKYGETAMSTAVFNGHLRIVQELIKAGVDVNLQGNYGRTVLFTASINCRLEIVQELIEAGANINLQDIYGQSALLFAKVNRHPRIVRELIKAGATN